jgi:flagellar protein FlaJ
MDKTDIYNHAKIYGKKSALFGLGVWLVIGIIIENILISLLIGLLSGIVVFFCSLIIPKVMKKNYSKKIEGEFPIVLMMVATELDMGISLEKTLKNAVGNSSEYLSKELLQVLKEYNDGLSLQKALVNFSDRVNSTQIRRVVLQLINVIDQGKKEEQGLEIKTIAIELLNKQKAEIKEFNGKLAVFSLLFISVSAIIPAMFQSFVIVGSVVLAISYTPLEILLIITVLFPLLDLSVLFFIRNKTPVFLGG